MKTILNLEIPELSKNEAGQLIGGFAIVNVNFGSDLLGTNEVCSNTNCECTGTNSAIKCGSNLQSCTVNLQQCTTNPACSHNQFCGTNLYAGCEND